MELQLTLNIGSRLEVCSKKDYESDTKGLKRTVQIYTLDGKLLKEYKGMIRVRDSDNSGRISLNLISENNRRVTIDNAI